MTKKEIFDFIKQYQLAVVATTDVNNKPQAAVVGFAINENLEIIFDTLTSTRKYQNIKHNEKVALVIGWDNEVTIQYEGIATKITDSKDDGLIELYFQSFPNGRERTISLPGLVHIKVTPTWIRYSDFHEPQVIEEWHR